ncbi:PREDICTED: uncharacterized protein LOC109243878 [Nicotiana attenuata]|uniref:uncharacterized protein LOC109243878 n=1 Tax=Nicotiana attenuata TaxID=49451 RepID=UPI000904867B|nr:PREDICTED: uncharacterized protein LOC109243878 [Nicotiana attenuata]
MEVCPEKPDKDAIDDQVKAYDKYVKADEMTDELREQNRAAKQTSIKAHLNTKMADGSSIRDHVLKMIPLLNELEVLGAVIDKESQVYYKLCLLQAASNLVTLKFEKASISKPKGDKKKKKKAHKVLAPGGATASMKKPKGKCYHCNQPGHHKKQCPANLAKLNK